MHRRTRPWPLCHPWVHRSASSYVSVYQLRRVQHLQRLFSPSRSSLKRLLRMFSKLNR